MNPGELFWLIAIASLIVVAGAVSGTRGKTFLETFGEVVRDVAWCGLAFVVLGMCGAFDRFPSERTVTTFNTATNWCALLLVLVLRKLGRIDAAMERLANELAPIKTTEAKPVASEPEELTAAALVGVPIKKKKAVAAAPATTRADDSNWPKL